MLLVLTGMNFDNKASLYEGAKASLKKFKGDDCSVNEKLSTKLEPAYLAENEDVLLAAGYVKNHEFNNQRRAREGRVSYEKSNTASQRNFNSQVSKRKMNPLGKDGRILTCKSCGSFRHMLPDCPDSWENMAKLSIADDEDVLYTKYNSNENASPEVNLTNVKEQPLRRGSVLH